jgi:isoleucyl-tRNA synthetase
LKVLGKRCGQKLKAIGQALTAWSFAEVAQVENGNAITVEGEAITSDDILLTRTPVAGAVTASQGAVSVALNTTLSRALTLEGLAREMISVIQQMRKDAQFDVSDRIIITWSSDDADLNEAITTHQQMIADEVLARDMRNNNTATNTTDINDRPIRLSVEKAG